MHNVSIGRSQTVGIARNRILLIFMSPHIPPFASLYSTVLPSFSSLFRALDFLLADVPYISMAATAPPRKANAPLRPTTSAPFVPENGLGVAVAVAARVPFAVGDRLA